MIPLYPSLNPRPRILNVQFKDLRSFRAVNKNVHSHWKAIWEEGGEGKWTVPSGGPFHLFKRWLVIFPAPQRIDLSVSFSEKDEAKSQGARWDAEMRTWFCPKGRCLFNLKRWATQAQKDLCEAARLTLESEVATEALRWGYPEEDEDEEDNEEYEEDENYQYLQAPQFGVPPPPPIVLPPGPAQASFTPPRPHFSEFVKCELDIGDFSCPVCLEPLHEPCGLCHVFCMECLKSALDSKRECPVCRAGIPHGTPLRVNTFIKKALCEAVAVAQEKEKVRGVSEKRAEVEDADSIHVFPEPPRAKRAAVEDADSIQVFPEPPKRKKFVELIDLTQI